MSRRGQKSMSASSTNWMLLTLRSRGGAYVGDVKRATGRKGAGVGVGVCVRVWACEPESQRALRARGRAARRMWGRGWGGGWGGGGEGEIGGGGARALTA